MESDWQQFTILLEEKVSARVAPLEEQLNQQQELIGKLTITLTTMLDLINNKPAHKVEQGKGKAEKATLDKVTGKTDSSDHDEDKQTGSGKE